MSGGGGSSGQTYYANQDKLFGTQADIAQNMYNEYANRAPTYLSNTASMTNEAMSGALAARARNQAGADASAALGQGLQAASRNMARYGAEYNPNRLAQVNQDAAIQGAATKSAAMNSAEQWAEDQKWNRNAGAYGQIAGMGSGAMEGMGSAARGFGGMAAQASQNDQANAQGMGMAGAYVGKALFADGGLVDARCRKKGSGIRMAGGGLVPVNWRAQPTSGGMGKKSGGVGQFLSGMAPAAMKYGLEKTGITDAVKGGLDSVFSGVKSAIVGPQTTELPMGTLTDIAPAGLDAASAAGADATTTAIGEEVGGIAGDAALTGAATTAAEAAALETTGLAAAEAGLGAFGSAAAGAEAGAAAGSVVPGIGTAIGAVAGLLASQLFADGGKVSARNPPIRRKDMTAGGKVEGPGTETSDDIPAWLPDESYVLNAEAVKLIGEDRLEEINDQGLKAQKPAKQEEAAEKVPAWLSNNEFALNPGAVKMIGLDTLDAINDKGLQVRQAKQQKRGPAGIESTKKTGLKLASGGNIGLALGSAAKTLMALDEQDQRKELIQIQKDNAARQAEEFGWKRKRNEAELGLLPDQTEVARTGLVLQRKQNDANLGLIDAKTANANKQLNLESIGLDAAIKRQPLENDTAQNRAIISHALSAVDVDDLPRAVVEKRQQGLFREADNGTAGIAKLADLIQQGDSTQVIRFMNAMNDAKQPSHRHAGVSSVGIEKDQNTKENVFVAKDAAGRPVMKMSASQMTRIRDSVGKSEYKTVNAGDSLVQIKGGQATPVFTAPESAKSLLSKQGPLERDVGYLVNQHGMSKDQALAHLNSAKTMTRDQFILKSVQDSIAMGKRPNSEEVANFGALYDSARQAPATQKPAVAQSPASNSPAQGSLNPKIKSLIGIP